MVQDTPRNGRGKMLLIVPALIIVAVVAYLLIANLLLGGDDTGEIDPQNGDSAPALVR